MSEIFYQITAKLSCKKQATAFLINEKIALTARHAVEDHISDDSEIALEFYTDSEASTKVFAKVIGESEVYDVAILELDETIGHIQNWPSLSSQKILSEDKWETVGFPKDWDSVARGSKFCYLKGNVYQISSFDTTAIYDIHLSSEYIDEDWELNGLSGSPIFINGEIKGIIIAQEYSVIKSPIKVISINKIVKFLEENDVKINTSFGSKSNLVNNRLDRQRTTCEELFEKVEYQSEFSQENLKVNSYYLKYDNDGEPQLNQLAQYLTKAITEYACDLVDIENGSKNPLNLMTIFRKTQDAIIQLQKYDKLGSLILWMLIEGVLGAPKGCIRLSLSEDSGASTKVHIGMNYENQLLLYLGDGKLNPDLKSAVSNSIEALKYVNNVEDDIFLMDEYIYEQVEESKLKDLLSEFQDPIRRNWGNVSLEITVFTGYDSGLLKRFEKMQLSKEQIEKIIVEKYIKECNENEEYICSLLKEETHFHKLKINWFTLPFKDVGDFEHLILTKLLEMGGAR
ncbi:Hachiman antiphage defense system protein HamA [Bacillus cereus group sp. BfR-BA-01400]|uniref:HamA C-terminal domain-containing protein n=1 Tax=Bacillus cereus group sp. BfR-BA-01400 TaxID=2920334 RepID=UPI001F593143